MLSQLDSDQGTTTTIFFVPNGIQKYRGTVLQITIGAKDKRQPYLGDLSIIISVRYHTHTHTHTPKHNTQTQNTHAPMRNQHQKKENKES